MGAKKGERIRKGARQEKKREERREGDGREEGMVTNHTLKRTQPMLNSVSESSVGHCSTKLCEGGGGGGSW